MSDYPRTYMKAMIAKKQEDPDRGLPVDIVASGEDEGEAREVLQALMDDFIRQLWEIGKTVEDEGM
jgi:hypothetical protein